MHIKTLKIQGFKSYRDQTAVEEFSPRHNVVVGRNGSGKSNFFAAIRFVLSDAYTSLSREERQALLHDSSSSTSTTLSAFVEIIFDNSDGRFPSSSGSDELVLRRTIGIKKDEYSIDRKSATKTDVMNLLEAAGFSRSNPYYIVPQGRITHLTNMKDADRLGLLKDVAGTKVYETRRADSLRIMEETQSKKEKIEETLTYIQERLDELDEERQELRDFNEQDKDRRSLEYTLYYREQQDLLTRLDELDNRRRAENGEVDDKQKRFFGREKKLKALEDELATLQHRSALQAAERDSLLKDRRDLARAKAEIEAQINDDEERSERVGGTREELQERLNALNERIATVEGELMGLTPAWEENMAKLNEAKNNLEATKARIQILFAKKGRTSQYRSQRERDEALHNELEALQTFQGDQHTRQDDVHAQIAQLTQEISSIESALTEKANALEERRSFIEQSARRWDEVKAQEEELVERKKEAWKEEHKLASSTLVAQEKVTAAQRLLVGMMDRPTALGLANLDALARRLELQDKVHGPLYRLFTVDEKYKTAVEITAGASLFHVVVEDDETASRLVESMTREKLGRVTFMPLNRLQPKASEFQEKQDALIMLKKLVFDQKYKKAMMQVFGRTVICPSLAVAASYVQSFNSVNAITLDGDKVDRKGALTGGYNDPKRSRLDAVRELNRWQEVFDSDNSRLTEVRAELSRLDQEITALTSERQLLEARSRRANRSREPLLEEVQNLRESEAVSKRRLQKLQDWLADLSRELQTVKAKRTALQHELETPLNAGLSGQENEELDILNARADEQEKAVMEFVASVTDLTNRKETFEIELNSNLKRERDAIQGQLEALQSHVVGESQIGGEAVTAAPSGIDERKRRLQEVRAQMADKQKRLERVEREVEELQQRIKDRQEEFDATTQEQIDEARDITRHEKVLTKIITKRREYESRKADVDQKLRDVGILSADAIAKFVDDSTSKVLKLLHSAQASLKKFSHINRRAIEQYENFAKQQEQLLERQEDLQKSSESITELIDALDMRKDEAIERTFKQVSKNFADVFERLVPMGRGSLIMQRRFDADAEEEEDDENEENQEKSSQSIENYVGVSIKVSFHSKVDEGLRIHQLSGGQKSLVALALIFAIQKCDPAAFYLFDEIDANLDAQYRTAVAAMIEELSEHAQFITTTFRPELVGVGDKHYGVFFSAQKISSLRPITQEEALRFVEASAEVQT